MQAQTPGSVSVFSSFAEEMGYKRKFGQDDVPSHGAIFMSNIGTKKECFQRKLFGLPLAQSDFVLHVKKGMILFLFEFEKRQLHGVFRATSNGEIDIDPNAFKSSGYRFPAQVPFTSVWNCNPLFEHEFKDAIRDNYFSWKKFKFGLSKDQVYNLMSLFRSKRISNNDPPRPCLRYHDDKPAKRDTRFDDNRKRVRDTIKFIKEDSHGFDIDEVDNQSFRTLRKERSHKDNKNVFLTNCNKESDDFGDCGSRKIDKHLDRSLGGLKRASDATLHFTHNIKVENEVNGKTNLKKVKVEHGIKDSYRRFGKNRSFRDYNRIKDEYQSNDFSKTNSGICTPDRGSQKIVDGWFFWGGSVESQQRTLTDPPLSKPKMVTESPSYEPKTSPFKPRGTDFGIKITSDEEFDLGNATPVQSNSDFTPVSEVSEQFQHPFEVNKIENTYEHGFPNSTSCDPSVIYDPEVDEFCHRPSNFTPGPGSSPTDNIPMNPSTTIPYNSESKCVRKFDRLNLSPKALHNESDEKGELDATVNKVMKMLEKIVSSPIKRESDVDIKHERVEGGESVIEDTKVCKKTNKNVDESTTPLKVESFLEKIEGQKSTQNGNVEICQVLEKEEQGICGFDEMVRVDFLKDDGKMCGWIEE
ncbi:hypothetical protein LXL04_014224 [Taraxacum kok-saghyz]